MTINDCCLFLLFFVFFFLFKREKFNFFFFFFSSRRRHTRFSRDWSSDVCSSDLAPKLMRQWPAPPNTHTHKVQVADGLLLVNHEVFPYGSDPPPGDRSAGLAV